MYNYRAVLYSMNYKDQFIQYYYTKLRQDKEIFASLEGLEEDSPWHREASVAIHTDMVVAQYLNLTDSAWTEGALAGALACAFHDVAKPIACEVGYKEEYGGRYKSFKGHEILSARIWEDYVIRNWGYFVNTFEFTPEDIYRVGYLIEHHLPYQLKDKQKRANLLQTIARIGASQAFFRVLKADTWGRISDNHTDKKDAVKTWINQAIDEMVDLWHDTNNSAPTCNILIGSSGCGKTSYSEHVSVQKPEYFSWDALRLEWYVDGDNSRYEEAFQASVADSEFNSRTQKRFMEQLATGNTIIVDNTGLSRKRRAFFVNTARQKGYQIVAHLFPIAWDEICKRQLSRKDKTITLDVAKRQYMSLQLPSYGEFDKIVVQDINLPEVDMVEYL